MDQQPISREQKVGYAVVIACGVLTVVFGMFYLVDHLQQPFVITYTGNRILTDDEEQAAEIARQKREDTDDDGINDYEELAVYGSSPYIADTDSDGLDDGWEVTNGMDPACASGTQCESTEDDIINDVTLSAEAQAAGAAAADAAAEYERIAAMLKALTPEEIRALLAESGADQAELAAMTDEQVQALYAQVLQQLEQTGGLSELVDAATQTTQTTP